MRKILTVFAFSLCSVMNMAQETVALNTGDITSPKLNANRTVTFSMLAPNAQKVQLEADFLPKQIV